MTTQELFHCPVCARPLAREERQYRCANGHTFDIARQGYVNLLLPHQRGTGDPGDSAEMIRGRGDFLRAGYYDAVSDRLNALVTDGMAREEGTPANILDAGCGEGYYLRRLKRDLDARFPNRAVAYYGIDLSRAAIARAAAADRTMRFAVASIHHLPLPAASLDVVLCLFAPRDEEEIGRVLTPRGRLIIAAPGPRHLYHFRAVLFDQPEPIGQRGDAGAGFTPVASANIAFEMRLRDTEDMLRLLAMTPYRYHAGAAGEARLRALPELVTEVDINLRVYAKA